MRLVLVDDHDTVRRSLKRLIELNSHFEVVGEGSNGMEAVVRVQELRPELVLMDVNMPVMSGVDATKAIKKRYPETKVLALTAFGDMQLVSDMVRAGASGYLLKGGSSKELVESLEAIAEGHGALDKEVTRGVMENMAELYQLEQERADSLAELDRMKSEFVSVVSHELRTPVTSIKGGVDTMRLSWGSIDEAVKLELLDTMSKQCDHLSSMIGQILTVAGIRRGGIGLRPSVFSLAEVAQEALDSLAESIDGRVVHAHLEDVTASGDRERVKDVAVALIRNALDFTFGSTVVEVGGGGDEVKLHVRDEGPGLSEDKLQRLLHEPFTQGDSSDTRRVGGLGLSLYIARQVLEASGGRLEVDTAPDSGSTFTMVLPSGDAGRT